MTTFYTFENSGIILSRTNYFESEAALRGEFYLTWNAGVARFLVPDNQRHILKEIRPTKLVCITPIKNGLDILFHDNTDYPYLIRISREQTDFVITDKDIGSHFQFSVYLDIGEKYAFPGIFK